MHGATRHPFAVLSALPDNTLSKVYEINDKAIGKQRPRYSSKTGRMYTPEATRSFEEKVKWAYTFNYNIIIVFCKYLSSSSTFWF